MGDASDIMNIAPKDVVGYLEYGGSVYGNSTFAPSPNEYFSDATDKCGAYYTPSHDEDQWSSSTNSTSSHNDSTPEDSKSTSNYRSELEDEPDTDDDSATVRPSSTYGDSSTSLATAESDQDTENGDDDYSSAAKDDSVAESSLAADEDAEQTSSPEPEEVLDSDDVQVPSVPSAIPKPVYRHHRHRPGYSRHHHTHQY